MIIVVDYGVGNVGSIANMLRKAGVPAMVSGNQSDIETATKLILPGVGAFDHGMCCLHERGLVEVLRRRVLHDRTPFLGICLGMHLLARRSAEGDTSGLGWLDADVVRFDATAGAERLTIPHMGWNTVTPGPAARAGEWSDEGQRFYFVHSFHLHCSRADQVWGWTTHGYAFPSAVRKDNICGVQFHPEKSHRFGLALLQQFAAWP